MSQPDLTVVMVNYNGKDDLLRCLAALHAVREELAFEVIVVDNGSTDGSVKAVEAQHPWVRVIAAGKNLGFAAACNRGLADARGRHALLLNPDTEVFPGALAALVAALDDNPRWGIVGPRMLDPDDYPYSAARRFPTPFYLFCECTRLVYLFPKSGLFAGYLYGDVPAHFLDRVDQIEGSALAISGEARRAVGPLDERFFLFFEEVDWCKRVAESGFEIHVVPAATVRHHRSTTMSRFYVEARAAHARSALAFFDKHHGPSGVRSLVRWMTAALLIRRIVTSLLAVLTGSELARLRSDGADAEWRVYRELSEIKD